MRMRSAKWCGEFPVPVRVVGGPAEPAQPVVRDVGGVVLLVERPGAGVGDDRAEPVGVPGHPVGQVATERRAEAGGPGTVHIGPFDHGVEQRLEVGPDRAGAVRPGPGDELRPVAGGQRRVGHQHGPAVRDRNPRVPPPAPGVERGERAAVDPQHQRSRPVAVRWQAEPAAHGGTVDLGGHLGQPAGRGRRRSRGGQRHRLLVVGGGVEPDRRRRGVDGRAQRVDPATVRRRAERGV